MTAIQLNALNTELWQGIGAIADSEQLMRRLAKYVRKLVAERQADPTEFTREEFFAKVDKAKKDVEEGKGHRFASVEELDKYIRSL